MELPVNNQIGRSRFIADVIISAQAAGQQICFILGSGASVSSGILAGGRLEMEWMNHIMEQSERYKREVRGLARDLKRKGDLDHDFADIEASWRDAVRRKKKTLPSEYYFDLFVLRFHGTGGGGIRELQERMKGREPGLGYCLLAQLMTRGECRNNIVITTNFDSMVEKAVYAFTDKTPITVSHEALVDAMSWQVRYPIVAKVHRDLMFSPLNSTREIKKLKEPWREPLQDVLTHYIPVVIGYAGADESLMSFLEEARFPNGLYWCYREKGEKPSDRVIRLVEQKKGCFVPIGGFDELMVEISRYRGPDDGVIDPAFLDRLEERFDRRVKRYRDEYDRIQKTLDAEEGSPAKAEDYFNRAYRHAEEGRYKEAIADYTEAITYKPDDAIAYYNRGNAYDDLGDYKAAIADYDRAIELKRDYAIAYNNRGNACAAQGDYKAAIADYDRAIELKPDYAKAYNNRGIAYRHQGDYEAAIADYDRAIALKPDYTDAYNNRGIAYRNQGGYNSAIADYSKAIALKPDDAYAYNNRGIAYRNQGDDEAAIADYDRAIALKPDFADAYNNRGNAYRHQGDYNSAIADYNKAITLKPDFALAYNNRGNAYRNLGDDKSAIADYNKAIELKPDYADAYHNRCIAHRNLGDDKAAEADLAKAYKLDPKNY